MSIVKASPREATFPAIFSDFFNNDPFFRTAWPSLETNGSVPAVNIRENNKEYKLELAAPGFRKEDFKVEVEDEMLKISAERTEKLIPMLKPIVATQIRRSPFFSKFSTITRDGAAIPEW